jgi:hypothetical protein
MRVYDDSAGNLIVSLLPRYAVCLHDSFPSDANFVGGRYIFHLRRTMAHKDPAVSTVAMRLLNQHFKNKE